jgi:hypothetical protein
MAEPIVWRASENAQEVWLPVPGWRYYEVSDAGRVRSKDRLVEYKDGRKPRLFSGRMLKPQKNRGYLYVTLSGPNEADGRFAVHQLVLLAFVGPCPVGHEVCHDNGNKADCRRSNLHYGTRLVNVAETYEQRGNFNVGVQNSRAKLTAEQLEAIRLELVPWKGRRLSGGIGVALASRYGVSKCMITEIHQGKRYARRGRAKGGKATNICSKFQEA